MELLKLLREAIKAVPAVKYALGVVGIAAAVALILGMRVKPEIAGFGTLLMLGFMFLLLVFSRYAGSTNTSYLGPAKVLVWFYTILVIVMTPLLIAKYVFGWSPTGIHSGHKSYISGIVTKAGTNAPIAGIVVRLESDDGRFLKQDKTDGEGKFSLEIPNDVSALQLVVSSDGYAQYVKKLPAIPTRNDILLEPLGVNWGVANDTPMDSVLQSIAVDLNVTFVFSTKCTNRARKAKLNGGQIQSDSKPPELIAK